MPAGQLTDPQIDLLFVAAGIAVPAERRSMVLGAARELKGAAVLIEAYLGNRLTTGAPAETPSVR